MSIAAEPDLLQVPQHPVKKGQPAWDIALLYPAQGDWTDSEYLALQTNLPIELSDGCLEFLPMPTIFHQRIAQYLFEILKAWVLGNATGEVFIAPLRVRLWAGKIRLPDIVYLRPERIKDIRRPPQGADLAIEVVSEGADNRERDRDTKRAEYARAGVSEYWIVDPQIQTITVLTLAGEEYRLHGEFASGLQATSVLLPGFCVLVDAAFNAGESAAG